MILLPTLLLNTAPEVVAFVAMASGSFSCPHQGGLYVMTSEVFCRDCGDVLGSVWDAIGEGSFDAFDETYRQEADHIAERMPAVMYEIDEWEESR